MKRLLPVLVVGAVFVPSAGQADGCPPSTCGTTSSAPAGSHVVFVRPNGRQGPLEAYDVRTGARRFRLPAGILSADGRTFVSSAAKADRSVAVRWDPRSGRVLRRWSLPGRWGAGGVSPNGRVIAYVRGIQQGMVLRVGDRRHVLRGSFEVEALSPNGRRMFLLHWGRRNGYTLKQLELATGRLSATRLADPDEKMTGQATNAVTSRDGRWLFTLYVKPGGETFVHALDLAGGIAHCIDLPLRGDFLSAGTTSLTLSPDETRLYLASPLAGRLTTVDVTRRRVTGTARFERANAQTYTFGIGPSGAVSSNGRMLAFVSAHQLWLVDTAFGVVRGPARIREYVLGVGFAPGGRQVVAITAHRRLIFDAATGKPVR